MTGSVLEAGDTLVNKTDHSRHLIKNRRMNA